MNCRFRQFVGLGRLVGSRWKTTRLRDRKCSAGVFYFAPRFAVHERIYTEYYGGHT